MNIRITCSRCGSYIGQSDSQAEATRVYREHIAQCEVDP